MDRRTFVGSAAAAALGALVPYASLRAAARTVDLDRLQARFRGLILVPNTPAYEQARKPFAFNPSTDCLPLAVVRPLDDADVARAIGFARANGLELAVRSGGHDVLGASTCQGGIVIDMALMNGIALDGSGGRAIVGGGALAGRVDATLGGSGRAVPLGLAETVGVSGLTLGGGLGRLVGKYGAACDNLLRARLVTADGEVLNVSANEHPDLYWAIRGGGGNFGVVTALEYRAHAVDTVLGGQICFEGAQLGELLRFYDDYMRTAPDELVVEVNMMQPSRPLVFVSVCWCGDRAEGERVLAPLRRFGPPVADGISVRPYASAMAASSEIAALRRPRLPSAPAQIPDRPGTYWAGGSVDRLDKATIDTIVERLARASGGWAFGLGHHMHGAVCRVDADATALARPKGAFTFHFDAWWASAAQAAERMAWVDASSRAIQPHTRPSYLNYLSSNAPDAVSQAYGAAYPRLRRVKRQYDPDNIFHRNRNIRA